MLIRLRSLSTPPTRSKSGAKFIDLMVREVGKPVAEAAGEVDRAIAILGFYSQVPLDPVGEVVPGSVPGARVLVERHPLPGWCWRSAPGTSPGDPAVEVRSRPPTETRS